ncbi:hypothetical protein CEXT_742371 [Caerostris extrusa]|uniref:Uncharacterized protein n=1 Tax=Caerostris extrusa TaxID=172846 RepID=A0AAV4TUG9_CAEEX|nr:hypothetical protein CEXT_742371 [Caerostris extrusa]
MEDKVKVLPFALCSRESFPNSVRRAHSIETMGDGSECACSGFIHAYLSIDLSVQKACAKKGTPVSTADQPEITVENRSPSIRSDCM